MRAILLLWAIPLTFFWTWYGLSANDISFGTIFFSRALHDAVFEIYGRTLGVPASAIPAMLAWGLRARYRDHSCDCGIPLASELGAARNGPLRRVARTG